MNILDLRPSCAVPCSPEVGDYRALKRDSLTAEIAQSLLPQRADLAMVWRYLAAGGPEITESPLCLCRKIVRWTGRPMSLGQFLTCLDIFTEVNLIETRRLRGVMSIRLIPCETKADLNSSPTMRQLLQAKER